MTKSIKKSTRVTVDIIQLVLLAMLFGCGCYVEKTQGVTVMLVFGGMACLLAELVYEKVKNKRRLLFGILIACAIVGMVLFAVSHSTIPALAVGIAVNVFDFYIDTRKRNDTQERESQ